MEGEESDTTDTEVLPRKLAEKERRNKRLKAQRASETPEQREERLAKRRRKAESETPEVRQARLAKRREKEAEQRRSAMSAESSQDSESSGIAGQLRRKNEKARAKRASETPEQREERLAKRRRRDAQKRLLADSASSLQSDDTTTEEEVMRQNVANWRTHKSVAAGSTTVMQGDAAAQCDRRADVAVQSTWCKEGVSKSTQAELFTLKVSRWTQSNDLEESYSTSPLLEQPSKAMPLVLSNSRRSDHGVLQEANVDGVIEGDSRFSADTGAARSEERASSLTVNAGSPFVAYSCRLCSLKFSELDALASHVKTCPWPEPFQCSLCLQTCLDWSATRRHLASHINRATPKCPFCEQSLDCRSWTIMRHMQRHHVHVKAFMCNFCWGTFVMKQDILTHTRRCRARVIELDKCLSSTKKCNSQAHIYPHLYKCSICLVTFADVSAVASHMQVHVNEMQHSQADRVIEKDPSDCSGQQSVATGSTKVMQGDASTQCDFRTDIAVKSMLADGISKATEAELCTPKISKWTQSEDLKVCNDESSLLELTLPNEGMPLVLRNSRRTSSGMLEHSELDYVAGGDCVLKVTTNPPCSEERQGSATVNAGSVVTAYACGLCSRKFQGLDSLTCHVLTCLWPEPFQCSLCSRRCVNWSVARDHLLTSHVNRATAKCQFCKQPLNLRTDCIVTHMLRLHVGVKLFMCNLCKATFYGRHSLLLHLRRRHECGMTHECDWCASSFADKRDLQAHILQHLSAWPYKCHICLATFVEKSDIASHMRDHKNGRC
ncbi:uncharacterized protein [Dermacentor andersoni]|uniref:uncharacterized protein isoform X2 n=1 Tax=Dermacentor andersoni TaxID=34620 RepID=UPI002417FA3C|nr:zinc finger protein Xfin-like isoform X2 [Dermacentor andersoni]